MGNNLSVKVTADVVDLQAKFAIAKAEVSGLTSELNKLAKASAAGMIDEAGEQKLQQLAGDLVHAKGAAAELAQQMKDTRDSGESFGQSLESIRGSISSAFQVTGIALAYEGILKMGEAIDRLGERAVQIHAFSEILSVTTDQFQAMQVAAEEAGTSDEVFARASERLITLLGEARDGSHIAADKLFALGVTTKDIADPTFQLNELLGELRDRLTNSATSQQTMNALIKDLGSRAALAAEAIKIYDGSVEGVKERMDAVNGITKDQVETLRQSKAWWGELGTAVSNTGAKIAAFISEAVSLRNLTDENLAKANLIPTVAAPPPSPTVDAAEKNKAERAAAQEKSDIERKSLKDEMDTIKQGVEAFAQGTAERLAALRQYAKDAQEYYGSSNVDAVRKANEAVIAEERAYAERRGSQAIAETRAQIATITGETDIGVVQRLEKERDLWQALLAGDQLNAQQRTEVQRSLNQTLSDINRDRQNIERTVSRSNVDTDIAISRMKIEARKNELATDLQSEQITADQKLQILRDLTDQQYQLNLKSLQDRLALLEQDPIEYARVMNQIRELKARNVLDLAALDRQASLDAQKQAKDQLIAWKGVVDGIRTSEAQLVSNVLTGRRSLGQSLLQLGSDLVQKEITQDLQAMTTKLLLARTEETAKKAMSEGGFLYHLLFEQRKTAATVVGEAERSAAQAAGAKTGLGISAATALKDIAISAYRAMAGAYAAIASIPYVGPFLAPVVAVAAGAAVFKFAQSVSAEGGYDIPAGVNPVVQAHQREMILPRKQADVIRDMAKGGGARTTRVEYIPVGGDHGLVRIRDLAAHMRGLNSRFAT